MDKWLPMKITHPQLKAARDALYKFCCEMAARPKVGRTAVIFGENGTGKSRLLRQVSKWLSSTAQFLPMVLREDLGDTVGLPYAKFLHWPSVIDEFQKRQDIVPLDDAMISTLTIFDDIGAEHDPSGYAREQLYLLLSRREFKWNLISTNYPPAEWHNRFERRIASRLFRNAEHIDLSEVPDFSST
jgi:DNA replication protein DnaC